MDLLKLSMIVFFVASIAFSASFDCTKASTYTEHTICQNAHLSELDEKLAELYSSARKKVDSPEELKQKQLHWLKNVRDVCTNAKCIEAAYGERIEHLETVLWLIAHTNDFHKEGTVEGSINLKIVSSDEVAFELDLLLIKEPSLAPNFGNIQGIAVIHGNEASYSYEEDYDSCRIVLKFVDDLVEIQQEGNCEMGMGVYVDGIYR